MSQNPEEVYCTICGMLLDRDCIVLSGPHWPQDNARTVSDKEVTRYTAITQSCYGEIHILPDNEQIYPQQTTDENHDHIGDGAPAKMYHGIHPACEDLANRVIKTSPNAKISGIGDLFLTLERRCASYQWSTLEQRLGPRDNNYVPPIFNEEKNALTCDGYYVPRNCIDQWGDEWAGWWDENPVNIPDLTTRLISNLEKAPQSSSSHHLQKSMEATPNEINDHIRNFVQGPFPLECTYIMPQSQWAEIFFHIPFLWDLDMETIYEKVGGSNKEDLEKWNWEKLTRQIMSPVPPMADVDEEDEWDHSQWYSPTGKL
ncbi:uncharacterized protein B0J16DRAFT_373045 [Fusarium flagelliforme]|uniref:uncharacterized protein n=1 Tax=Fusarium flagelliforme TaxID=2675880 RepID=UPI001E8D9342|nr:uncharacterized protein B0J16DRAFT_373045 [Fusarium flagelliforme]KAH7182407.1 hypothetical protein B0J16DRAFT_373045 [Fusarium flagelliforme]